MIPVVLALTRNGNALYPMKGQVAGRPIHPWSDGGIDLTLLLKYEKLGYIVSLLNNFVFEFL